MIIALIRQWFGTGFVAIVSILLSIILARILGPFEFGTYSYVLGLASIFAIVQDGGFKTLLFREKVLPSDLIKSEYDLFCTSTVHLLFITLSGAGLLFVLRLPHRSVLLPAIFFIGLRIYAAYYSAQLKGEGRFGYEAFWQILVRMTSACAMVAVLIFFQPSIASIFWAGALGLFILVVFFVPGRPLRKFKFRHYRYLFKNTFAFLIIDAATVIYFKSDIILIKYIHPDSLETGYYSAAYRFLEGVILFIFPISQICFRYLRVQIDDTKRFICLLKIMLYGAVILAIFIATLGYISGPWLTNLIYGVEFLKAGVFVQWLFLSLLFIIPNAILTQAAIALNLEKKYAVAAVFLAVVNILLNLCLIPAYGGIGSVWATFISEGVLSALLLGGVFMTFSKKKIKC